MSVINTGAIAKALRPGVNEWFGMGYKQFAEQWSQIFDVESSSMNFEEDVALQGFQLAKVKPEGVSLQYDTMSQAWYKRYVHIVYALGFIITREHMEDNLYMKIVKQRSQALGNSMRQTKEIVCANHLNRATSGSYLGGDGKSLLATDHPISKGGTCSNKLAVAADLSETSLENLLILLDDFRDEAGLRMNASGIKLILPKELRYEAERILKSPLQNDTANNAINTMKGILTPVVNNFLTDTDMYFIKTDVPNGLKVFDRRALEVKNDTPEFDTENMKFKSSMRFSSGWTDWRGVVGSEGAA